MDALERFEVCNGESVTVVTFVGLGDDSRMGEGFESRARSNGLLVRSLPETLREPG